MRALVFGNPHIWNTTGVHMKLFGDVMRGRPASLDDGLVWVRSWSSRVLQVFGVLQIPLVVKYLIREAGDSVSR